MQWPPLTRMVITITINYYYWTFDDVFVNTINWDVFCVNHLVNHFVLRLVLAAERGQQNFRTIKTRNIDFDVVYSSFSFNFYSFIAFILHL